jgi:polysaccharide biosynthesis/export protein
MKTTAIGYREARAILLLVLAFTFAAGCAQRPLFNSGGTESNAEQVRAPHPGEASGYLIGPEDTLEISVWREEGLQREVLVRPDGRISFPLAGDLQAAGKTAEQVGEEIKQRISRYIPDPVVTVSVAKVAGYKIYVLGQVSKPGEFVVGRYVDVMQALTLAGGLTPYASQNNIKILRRGEDGEEIVLPFRYAAVRNGQDLWQNVMLQSGDVVVVP